MNDLPIIGRDRVLIDKLAKLLHDKVRSAHDYGPMRETSRGVTFEVRLLADGAPSGRIARVTIELDRVEGAA